MAKNRYRPTDARLLPELERKAEEVAREYNAQNAANTLWGQNVANTLWRRCVPLRRDDGEGAGGAGAGGAAGDSGGSLFKHGLESRFTG